MGPTRIKHVNNVKGGMERGEIPCLDFLLPNKKEKGQMLLEKGGTH